MSEVRFPVRLKLALFAALLAVVPVVGVGFGLIGVNRAALETTSRQLRLLAAEDLARVVADARNEATSGVFGLTRALADSSLDAQSRLRLVLTLLERDDVLDHAVVLDAEGNELDVIATEGVVVPASTRGAGEALEAWVKDGAPVIDGGVVWWGGMARQRFIAPVIAADRTTGWIVSDVPLSRVQERVEFLASRLPASEHSIFVATSSMRLVAHPDKTLAEGGGPVVPNHLLEDLSGAGAAVAQSGEFVRSGEVMLGSVVPIADVDWAVAVEVPESAAYESVERMQLIVATIAALAALLAVMLAFFGARLLTRPVDRLVELAGALARRDFSYRVLVDTADELETLAQAMHGAAEELEASEAKILEEAAIRADLGRYLPRTLVDDIVAHKHELTLGGVRREITVLFADVVRFTPLCDQNPPEVVVSILNELFTILTEIVFRHGGTVDKFVGDCIMAVWGAAHDQPKHAAAALEAAEAMIRWVETGNIRWKKEHGIEIELAIGVHTGEAVVGNIGSEQRMEYTAIGSTVNVAARLEALARPNQILSTDATRRAAGSGFRVERVPGEALELDGGSLEIYEVRL